MLSWECSESCFCFFILVSLGVVEVLSVEKTKEVLVSFVTFELLAFPAEVLAELSIREKELIVMSEG